MNLARYRDTIMAGSFLTWAFLLTFPLLTASAALGSGNEVLLFQVAGGICYLAIAFLLGPSSDLVRRLSPAQLALLFIIYLSLTLQLHDDPSAILTGIAYTVALLVSIIALTVLYSMPTELVAKCLAQTSIIFAGFGVTAVALFGWPSERHLGPIHPNSFGTAMLSAFILSQFRKDAVFVVVRIVSFLLAASVSSRFALIGSLLALIVFEVTSKRFSLKLLALTVMVAAGLAVFHQHISEIFALNDPARNLDSGFTGRGDEWLGALELIEQNPFGMGFKRPPYETAGHNGYLKVILEFGIVGGGLIIALVLSIVLGALYDALTGPNRDDDLRRFACARAAGLVALAFATFFQPQMFNLGDVHGVPFMLLLFQPAWRPFESARLRGYGLRLAACRAKP